MKLEEKRAQEADDTRYSAGAEEHVVTTGVGSSQYGGSVRARDNTKKKKKKKNFGENFLGIRPEPGDGSMDYSATHDEALDFKGFRFYVMAGTSVRRFSDVYHLALMKYISIFAYHLLNLRKQFFCGNL